MEIFDMKYITVAAVALALAGFSVSANEKDKPFQVDGDVSHTFENSIAARIQLAMRTLPDAKSRFIDGLPKGQSLYLTIRIAGNKGKIEQVFIKVTNWGNTTITGTLANKLCHATGYEVGQEIKFGEGDILDWTISKPDGSFEGNYIGKFVNNWLNGSASAQSANG